jgi:hypothetical protein
MTQAILKGKGKEIYQRYKAVVYRQDEYDTFNEIFSICPPDQTTFFFLIDSHSPEDARFSYRTPALRHLIRTIADKGYEVGLHPSYTSYQNQLRLAFEKKALSEILGKEITRSRQHFLRYTLPTTFQYLAEIGIMDEYSYGFTHQVGFPCGMMKSYNHYDLSTESISPIRIHPFLMMDRSLQKYISGTKSEKMARVREVWNWTKKLGGEFRILLHNDVLSNSPEWDGWGDEIRNIIAYSTMP